MAINEWSTTATNNASGVTGVNFAEGQAPSTLNDSCRAIMADVATWYGQAKTPEYLTSIAGTNTITAAGPAALASLQAGQRFTFIPANTNTGATTLNITPSGGSALTAKAIFAAGIACIGGEIKQNVPVEVLYDGTQFNIIGYPNIPALTADSTPDATADYVMTYDASASGNKKVLLTNLGSSHLKAGSTTRDTSTASGTQAITGVGFTPKAVILFAGESVAAPRLSFGFDDSSGRGAITKDASAVGSTWGVNTNAIYLDDSAGGTYAGTITSFGADGFTITWVKTGSPTGTITIKYLAIG